MLNSTSTSMTCPPAMAHETQGVQENVDRRVPLNVRRRGGSPRDLEGRDRSVCLERLLLT